MRPPLLIVARASRYTRLQPPAYFGETLVAFSKLVNDLPLKWS